jgi:hypothetical protein
MVNDHRFDPYWLGERKGGAFAAASAPKLRTGRFKATDKLIAVLKDAPIMRSKKTTR